MQRRKLSLGHLAQRIRIGASEKSAWWFDGLRHADSHNKKVSFTHQNTTFLFKIQTMNSKQMKKWLAQQGATFTPGKGSHLIVFLNGRKSVFPMHGTAELGKALEAAIKRQLGLK